MVKLSDMLITKLFNSRSLRVAINSDEKDTLALPNYALVVLVLAKFAMASLIDTIIFQF